MLQLNPKNDQVNRLSGYYAAQLINKEWMQPTNETHEIFPVTVSETKEGAHGMTRPAKATPSPFVTVYAVHRPDKQWALLAINKHPDRTARLNVEFNIAAKQPITFGGQIEVIQFSRRQYVWHADGPKGHPTRSLPPARFALEASPTYELPPYSLTVLRGELSKPASQ
jgi:hypothetical protein